MRACTSVCVCVYGVTLLYSASIVMRCATRKPIPVFSLSLSRTCSALFVLVLSSMCKRECVCVFVCMRMPYYVPIVIQHEHRIRHFYLYSSTQHNTQSSVRWTLMADSAQLSHRISQMRWYAGNVFPCEIKQTRKCFGTKCTFLSNAMIFIYSFSRCRISSLIFASESKRKNLVARGRCAAHLRFVNS